MINLISFIKINLKRLIILIGPSLLCFAIDFGLYESIIKLYNIIYFLTTNIHSSFIKRLLGIILASYAIVILIIILILMLIILVIYFHIIKKFLNMILQRKELRKMTIKQIKSCMENDLNIGRYHSVERTMNNRFVKNLTKRDIMSFIFNKIHLKSINYSFYYIMQITFILQSIILYINNYRFNEISLCYYNLFATLIFTFSLFYLKNCEYYTMFYIECYNLYELLKKYNLIEFFFKYMAFEYIIAKKNKTNMNIFSSKNKVMKISSIFELIKHNGDDFTIIVTDLENNSNIYREFVELCTAFLSLYIINGDFYNDKNNRIKIKKLCKDNYMKKIFSISMYILEREFKNYSRYEEVAELINYRIEE